MAKALPDDAHLSQAAANVLAARLLMLAFSAPPSSPPRPVVVSPGSRSAPLVLALAQTPGVAVHVVLDERIAGFVALGLARAQGCAALAVCTSGSAGAHYLPAVIEAFEAEVPLVLVTADRPPELQQIGAPQTTSQQALFGAHLCAAPIIPPVPRAGPAAASYRQAWARMGAQALAASESECPGPVQINAPFAEPLIPAPTPKPSPAPLGVHAMQRVPAVRRMPCAALWALAQRLRAAPPGLLVCGPQLGRRAMPALGPALAALAQALGWPLWLDGCSQLRGTTKAQAYPLLLGAPTFARTTLPGPIVLLGHPLTDKRAHAYLARCAAGRAVMLTASLRLRDPSGLIGEVLAGDVYKGVLHLTQALGAACPAGPRCVPPLWEAPAHAAIDRAIEKLGDDDGALWEGAALVAAVRGLVPDTLLQLGNSLTVRDFDLLVHDARLEVNSNRGVNGIDGTLATALGCALAQPQRPVAVILGELSFLHDIAALQAARQLDVRMVIVVIDNRGGGIFRQLPIAAHKDVFARFFETPQQADIGALTRAMGARHSHVQTGNALTQAVVRAQHEGGIEVIEVSCAPDAQDRRAQWLATCYGQLDAILQGADA